MLEFISRHFDMKPYGITWLALLTAVLILPCIMFLPERCGYENGLLENIQILVLFWGLYIAFNSKIDKKFFIFAGLVLLILILREINCGRTLFFPIPGYENAYYRWSDIKYGYLVHPIFITYIACVGIYFLKNKLFINLWNYICKTKLPFWNIILMLTGLVLGLYAEHFSYNMVFEEAAELLFYVSLIGTIWIYSQNK